MDCNGAQPALKDLQKKFEAAGYKQKKIHLCFLTAQSEDYGQVAANNLLDSSIYSAASALLHEQLYGAGSYEYTERTGIEQVADDVTEVLLLKALHGGFLFNSDKMAENIATRFTDDQRRKSMAVQINGAHKFREAKHVDALLTCCQLIESQMQYTVPHPVVMTIFLPHIHAAYTEPVDWLDKTLQTARLAGGTHLSIMEARVRPITMDRYPAILDNVREAFKQPVADALEKRLVQPVIKPEKLIDLILDTRTIIRGV